MTSTRKATPLHAFVLVAILATAGGMTQLKRSMPSVGTLTYQPIARTGAVGLMQLMPDTAERFGVKDRTDPEQNIMGGAKYLNFLLQKFRNPKLAIAAYNAGEGSVKKHGNKIPPFKETRQYVPRVLAFYKKYRDA